MIAGEVSGGDFAAYAGAGAAILVAAVGGLFKLLHIAVRKNIDEAKAELKQIISDENDTAIKQFGETVQAIRQKMSDMELWNRDNFVSRRTFDLVVTEIKDSLRRFEDKFDRWMDKADEKYRKPD